MFGDINLKLTVKIYVLDQKKIMKIEVDIIKNSLDEYLEFDSSELFESKFNLVRIFGGAIRDIIAGQNIRDIDIICGSRAMSYIESVLERNGYNFLEGLNGKDLQEMYSEIHVICEPHTWIKGKKIIQLIKPSRLSTSYRLGFEDIIRNVDFSCCGVSYDGNEIFEDFPNAILHCQSKVFSVNKNAKMYSQKRALHRKIKLQDRGWKEIDNTTDINRDLKIEMALK
jgi:hypothetical protein